MDNIEKMAKHAFKIRLTEEYSGSGQTSAMELFAKIGTVDVNVDYTDKTFHRDYFCIS